MLNSNAAPGLTTQRSLSCHAVVAQWFGLSTSHAHMSAGPGSAISVESSELAAEVSVRRFSVESKLAYLLQVTNESG